MKKNPVLFLSRFILFPGGSLILIAGIILYFNFKSCAGEIVEFRESLSSAEENFIEGSIEARAPLLRTKFSNTPTIAYYQEADGEVLEKTSSGKFKKKNSVLSLKSAAIPFLLKSQNYYIFFGLFGKEFIIDHDFDFINKSDSVMQYEKHIYDKDYISIYTESGNLKNPESISSPYIFFRGSKTEWIKEVDKRLEVWNKRITYSLIGIYAGVVILFLATLFRIIFQDSKVK